MKKILIISIVLFVLNLFCVSASGIPDAFDRIDSRVDDYNNGRIDIAQFLVYVNYEMKKAYQELEDSSDTGHFEGLTEKYMDKIFGGEDAIVKETNDFGLRLESYKGSILIGLQPSQKAIDRAISEAEEAYIDSKLKEAEEGENQKTDEAIKAQEKEIKELRQEIDEKREKISAEEDEDARKELKDDVTDIEAELAEAEQELENLFQQLIERGDIQLDIDIDEVVCKARLEQDLKIRKLFEKALPGFPQWYFNILNKDVDTYLLIASGHEFLMRQVFENERAVAEDMKCAGLEAWPDFKKISVNHEKKGEKFKLWEEENVESSIGDVWATYYQFYFMPSKDLMRDIIEVAVERELSKSVQTGDASGYASDVSGRMEKIEKLADKYGGSFDALVTIKENDKKLLYKQVTINPDVVFRTQTPSQEPDVDIEIIIDYKRMYDFMEYVSVDLEATDTVKPEWIEKRSSGSNAKEAFGLIAKGFKMWILGVKVKPITEVPKLLINLRTIIDALGD